MRRLSLSVAPLTLLLLAPTYSFAQTCLGTADVSSQAPLLVGGSVRASDPDVSGYFASFGGGDDRAFTRADVGFSRADIPNTDLHVTVPTVALTIGGQIPASGRRVVTCPLVELTSEWLRDMPGLDIDVWDLTVAGGISAGAAVVDTGRLRIVPTAAFLLAWTRSRVTAEPDFRAVETELNPRIVLGVGIVNGRASFTPTVTVGPDGDTELRAQVTVVFPRR